jgi:hypothetical protein
MHVIKSYASVLGIQEERKKIMAKKKKMSSKKKPKMSCGCGGKK